jgi:hypothetical protein
MLHTNDFDFSKTAVIKPPFQELQNKEITRKFTRFVIDSRDRNMDLYPSPSQYEIELDDDIEEVTSAEIVLVDMPFPSYLINEHNNLMRVTVANVVHNIRVDVGDYNETALANALSSSLNAVSTGALFEIVYNPIKDNYNIWSNVEVTLTFQAPRQGVKPAQYLADTIGKVLGFSPKIYTSTSGLGTSPTNGYAYVIKAEYRKNFTDHRYVVLHMDQMNVNRSSNNVIMKSFALVHPRITNISYLSTMNRLTKTFNPPIARLYKLRLTFRDYYGNIYDFQNQDHRIEIMFESRKHIQRYMP